MMLARIVIAGQKQCQDFHQACLVADHLAKNLPEFRYERIVRTLSDWGPWLNKMNTKNRWHHQGSPLVWKELLTKGSKAYYIGGNSEFLDYCHAYYKLDMFMSDKVFMDVENGLQYENKLKAMKPQIANEQGDNNYCELNYTICISGAAHKSTPHIIAGLFDMSEASPEKKICKIFLYDKSCGVDELEAIENDCSYVDSIYPNRVVKTVQKLGQALAESNMLVIMDHVPFCADITINDWLLMNVEEILPIADCVNASAPFDLRIVFPNFGPSCFNATMLSLSTNRRSKNIVVATADLGLEALPPAAEIADVPLRNMFNPPVWGFVGVNHIVDMRTTYHKYYTFRPYPRCLKVENSTLKVGSLTPEMRTLEYLMHWDRSLWLKVAERKKILKKKESESAHKIVALLGIVKLWLFGCSTEYVANLGVTCNGSFGLTLKGVFSQPSRLINGVWEPAADYLMPRDPYVKPNYLEKSAKRLLRETKIPHGMIKRFASSTILAKNAAIAMNGY